MYTLEKFLWSEEDYDLMGWHDANIWALAFNPDSYQIMFDIDYLFKWIDPVPPNTYYSYYVSPCTLIFEAVQNIEVDIKVPLIQAIAILSITRKAIIKPSGEIPHNWQWNVELDLGNVHFESSGYRQIVRAPPIYSTSSVLSLEQRQGISFATKACGGV